MKLESTILLIIWLILLEKGNNIVQNTLFWESVEKSRWKSLILAAVTKGL